MIASIYGNLKTKKLRGKNKLTSLDPSTCDLNEEYFVSDEKVCRLRILDTMKENSDNS